MNIDKQEMTFAYLHRNEPKYFNRFINYIDQIGNFCVHKLNIDTLFREDVKQIAVEHAYRKMDHYDPNSGHAAYSYFYKVILRRCLYELRDIKKKKDRMPDMCSFDKIYNSIINYDDSSDTDSWNIEVKDYSELADSEIVLINNSAYNRSFALKKIKESKSIVRHEKLILKRKRLYSLRTQDYFTIEDRFIRMTCFQILEKKSSKMTKGVKNEDLEFQLCRTGSEEDFPQRNGYQQGQEIC